MKRTTHSKYLFENKSKPNNYSAPIIIIGCKIKTPQNIGSIIRLADNMGCREVLFIKDDETIRESKIRKTAASSFNSMKWEFCDMNELESKIPSEFTWFALETTNDSENIYHANLPQKIALFVGNEIVGIDSEILDKCQRIIHIPLPGNNTSMNVSHALAVALFEWQRKTIY